jgi:hypothetical protein
VTEEPRDSAEIVENDIAYEKTTMSKAVWREMPATVRKHVMENLQRQLVIDNENVDQMTVQFHMPSTFDMELDDSDTVTIFVTGLVPREG